MAVRNAFGLLALDTTVAAVRDKVDSVLTKAEQIRALLAGTVQVAGPVTNTELRAAALPVTASGTVDLGATSLAALEQITATIANWPGDFPDAGGLAKLETVRALLAGTLGVSGTVSLGSGTVTALTSRTDFPDAAAGTTLAGINTKLAGTIAVSGPVTDGQLRAAPLPVSGTVDLSTAALAALETINAVVGNWPSDFPDAGGLAKLETVRALLAGTLTVSGTVAVSGTVPVSGPLTDTQLRASAVTVAALDGRGTPSTESVTNGTFVTPSTPSTGLSVAGYRAVDVMVTGTFTGYQVVYEVSNDGTNWVGAIAQNASSGSVYSAGVSNTMSTQNHHTVFTGGALYMRMRATALTTGSPTVTLTPITDPATGPSLLLVPNGTQNVDSELAAAAALADGAANSTTATAGAAALLYNGSTWDRQRGNVVVVADASSARSSSSNGATQTNYNARGALVLINATAVTGSGNVTFRLEWSPDGGTTWATIDAANLVTTAVTATGTRTLLIYPGVTAVANGQAGLPLPRTWRVAWTLNSGTSVTTTHTVSYLL